MTVANYLQNKNVQSIYLSSIKKKEDGENTEESIINTSKSISTISTDNNINIVNNNLNSNNNISNNIILQSKTVAPVTNTNMNKTINYSTVGNVITFNKSSKFDNNNIINKPETKPKPGDFSESLQKYITRAFERCKNDEERANCQKGLMKIISASMKKGDFNTRDWDKHPLPAMTPTPTIKPPPTATLLTTQELNKREKRKGRFDLNNITNINNINNYTGNNFNPRSSEEVTKTVKVIGTCQSLEKPYLRLTTLPDPSQVRPEHILVKSLKLLKDKWKKKEGDYNYVSEQFRSIRQDMTIQHLKNEFTVRVYETHARIALESYDLDQFNQCQTALINLYEEGLKGSRLEFLAYRIIYTTLQGIRCDMDDLLKDIHQEDLSHGIIIKNFEISHALKIMKAINAYNYFEFFKLYKIAPNMGSYLIEPFLPRLRIKALQVIAVGYYTECDIGFISEKFAFESVEKCIMFFMENQLLLSKDKTKLLCKESLPAINNSKLLAMMQVKISNI
jgi:hypothetical protein